MDNYDHTETGWVIIAVLGSAFAAGLAIAGAAYAKQGGYAAFIAPAIVLLALAAFYKMRVTVDGEAVRFSMGVGLIRKTVLLSEISAAYAASSPWHAGWGIRYIGNGWLFNVSSLNAVELTLNSGRRIMIGTDDQAGLHAAVLRRLK